MDAKRGHKSRHTFCPAFVRGTGHHQLLGANFDSGKIQLVPDLLLGLGSCRGSPTLSPLQSSLRIQAPKASDSPRLGRRGRGAYLPDRLSTRGRASAQNGLPAETTNHRPEDFLTRNAQNKDTSADFRLSESLRPVAKLKPQSSRRTNSALPVLPGWLQG